MVRSPFIPEAGEYESYSSSMYYNSVLLICGLRILRRDSSHSGMIVGVLGDIPELGFRNQHWPLDVLLLEFDGLASYWH